MPPVSNQRMPVPILPTQGQQGAQDAAAIQREGRQQVERRQQQVGGEDVAEQGREVEAPRPGQTANEACQVLAKDQRGGNHNGRGREVDRRACGGNDQFLRRPVGHLPQLGYATQRRQDDLLDLDAVVLRGEGVAQFMQRHQNKQNRDRGHTEQRAGQAAGQDTELERGIDQDERKGEMEADVHPTDRE